MKRAAGTGTARLAPIPLAGVVASTAAGRLPSTVPNGAPRPALVRGREREPTRNWFRRSVWLPACQAAKLGFSPRVHDLRHAHASWLLAGGADLQVVKERLGHASIMTTQKYLHTLPDADDTALDALTKIRGHSQEWPA